MAKTLLLNSTIRKLRIVIRELSDFSSRTSFKKPCDCSRAARPKLRCLASLSDSSSDQKWSNSAALRTSVNQSYVSYIATQNPGAGTTFQDLKRFLDTVGSDPKEVRYWMKQFQLVNDPYKPFAVVMVEEDVFTRPDMLNDLCSGLSFLHRNGLKSVIIHGQRIPYRKEITHTYLQQSKRKFIADTIMLVNVLESHGVSARPLFGSNGLLLAERLHQDRFGMLGRLKKVNVELIKWCLGTNHIPIIYSIGETDGYQLLGLDCLNTLQHVSISLGPRKVLMLNTTGGIHDIDDAVIGLVNMPGDLDDLLNRPWCNEELRERLYSIATMLDNIPDQSSIVITSADTIITELFTHHGSGTLFKNTEKILKFTSLDDVDLNRLDHLFTRSFDRRLKHDYFSLIKDRLSVLYLSEGYNAAAIITKEANFDVPYLDKFAVTVQSQGQGTAEMLWESIQQDFPVLFWRSRHVNYINPWYFARSEGSWSNGRWIVFWRGLSDPKLSYALVEYALSLPESFKALSDSVMETEQP